MKHGKPLVEPFKESAENFPNKDINRLAINFVQELRQQAIDEEFEKKIQGIEFLRAHLAKAAINGSVSIETVHHYLDLYLEGKI